MAYLKEDGSLDIQRYQIMSVNEFIKEFDKLTTSQMEEYINNAPIDNSRNGRGRIVNCTMDDFRKKYGTVDAKEFMETLRKKYLDKG